MRETLDNPLIGGKAKGLNFLKQNGYLVPKFYSIPFNILNDKQSLEAEILNILSENPKTKRWAVRSSASIEDGELRSFAGQFKTILNVNPDNIKEAVYNVVNSYSSLQEKKYGVIIQKMVEPEISGVIFSRDPVRLNSLDTIVSTVPGVGSKLVSGELEGCTLTIKDDSIYAIDKGKFEGFQYSDESESILHLTHVEIQNVISRHLSEIIDGIRKLEKLLHIPVDVEFSIVNNQLFWLQQRPITNRSYIYPSAIWDKTAAEISFPGLTLPLSCSLNNRTVGIAFQKVDAEVGYSNKILSYNERFSQNMTGEINGALYYNVTSWQSLIYQLPFGIKYAKQLPKTWGMTETPFVLPIKRHNWIQRFKIAIKLSFMLLRSERFDTAYKRSFQNLQKLIDQTNLDELSPSQLIELYLKIENELTEHYFAPVSNGYFTMIAFTKLKKQLLKTNILETYPNFANDILMNQKDFISVIAVDLLHDLLTRITQDPQLSGIFGSEECSDIITFLNKKNPAFLSDIKTYLSAHGERSPNGDLKIENTTFSDDLCLFIEYLKTNVTHYKPRITQSRQFDYQAIINQEFKLSFFRKKKIFKLIKKSISRTRKREMYRYERSQAFAISRKIFKQIGDTLNSDGFLENADDIAYLSFEQLHKLENKDNFKNIVHQKKEEYEGFKNQEHPATFVEHKDDLHPVFQQTVLAEGADIKGVGCCSGIVTGKVFLIKDDTDLQQDFSDYILIGKYFAPGQMNLISSAKGIISERGNLLSHTAIICREMGIPSIVGAKGITNFIANDAQIKMNGGTGIIQML